MVKGTRDARTRLSLNYTFGFNNSYETSVMLMGYLREERSVVVDVLEVDLDVGVTDQAVAAVVLSEDGEAPLRSAAGFVSVERLK